MLILNYPAAYTRHVSILLIRFSMLFVSLILRPPSSTLFPYTTLFRSAQHIPAANLVNQLCQFFADLFFAGGLNHLSAGLLRRSEEHSLNSSHVKISYAVFCLKKKKKE